MITKYLIAFIIGCTMMCCDDRTTVKYFGTEYEIRNKAIKLNDKAVELFLDDPDNVHDALRLLAESIKIDSNYYTAYHNKLEYEESMVEYNYGLKTIEALVNHFPENRLLYLKLGFIQEENKLLDQAKKSYQKSLDLTATRMKEGKLKSDSIGVDLAVLNYLTGDTLLGLKLYDTYVLDNPNNAITKNKKLKDLIWYLKGKFKTTP